MNFIAPSIVGDLVRVGSTNDGGYVIPQVSISETDFLVSLGISENWSFDEHFRKLNPDIRIHAYDHTISRQVFIKRLQLGIAKLVLGKSSISDLARRISLLRSYRRFFTGKAKHFEERIHNRIDQSYDATLDRVFTRADSRRIFLKIDIEGSEYRIVDDVVKYADRLVGMVIEFHDTDPLRPLFIAAIKKLQECFEIVHLHANNFGGVSRDSVPEVLEVTFIRRSNDDTNNKRKALPIPSIDAPNDPSQVDYRIRFDF